MTFKVLEEKENKILDRKELVVKAEFVGKTPSNADIKKQLAEHFKTNEALIVIEHIYQEFGLNIAKVHAKIYNSEESLKKTEFIKKRKKVKEGEGGEANSKKAGSEEKGKEAS